MSSPASRSAVPVARVSRVSTTRARRFSIKTRYIGQIGWLARSLRHYRASGSVVEACVALGSVGRGYSDPASASESSTLKSWRTRVVARTGVRKAKVALARKPAWFCTACWPTARNSSPIKRLQLWPPSRFRAVFRVQRYSHP